MAFDPDAYLQSQSTPTASGFDPVAYLSGQPQQAPQQPSFGSQVMDAAKASFQVPAQAAEDLATNPVTMAKALPPLMGVAGAVSPIPGGATLGTVGGRQISNEALRLLGHPEDIPSTAKQVGEGVLAGIGDAGVIPAVKGNIYGGQIEDAEKAAGIITRGATKAVTPGNVGQTLNDLEAQIDAGTITDPQTARDAKEVVDQIYNNPHIYEKSPGIQVQSARVSGKVQGLLNQLTPARAAPAAAFGTSQTIPDAIGSAWQAVPQSIKKGAGYGTGIVGAGDLLYNAISKILGGR
jgi:hypothetical protein